MYFDILEKLRASGKGWQTRPNQYTKEVVLRGDLQGKDFSHLTYPYK